MISYYALRLIIRTATGCPLKIDRKGKTPRECKREKIKWAIDYLDANIKQGWRTRTQQPKAHSTIDATDAEDE